MIKLINENSNLINTEKYRFLSKGNLMMDLENIFDYSGRSRLNEYIQNSIMDERLHHYDNLITLKTNKLPEFVNQVDESYFSPNIGLNCDEHINDNMRKYLILYE